jgi:hypothetical protein
VAGADLFVLFSCRKVAGADLFIFSLAGRWLELIYLFILLQEGGWS